MKIKIDHIGWVTNDLKKFESFWVKIFGFKKIWESYLAPEITKTLFGINCGAKCLRYKKNNITIECHLFDKPIAEKEPRFWNFGINHIALHMENRKKFLKKHNLKAHTYHNPKGWNNIFIRDFEGNWIELRETL